MAKKVIQSIKRGLSQSRAIKVIRNKYVVVTLFFLVWILFIDTGNLFVWLGDIKTVSLQEQQKEYYRKAIKETEEKLNELGSNKDSLEKFAREQYLFHEPDEEVFIITE